jgi:formate dehydrogenase subunit beta
MATTARIQIDGQGPVVALQGFFKKLLEDESLSGVMLPVHLFRHGMPMPTLVTRAEELDKADPLAPAFPMNSAKLVSRLTRGASGGRTAVVMRPCEIRAFIELVKLNQGSLEEVILIGMDCPGAFDNTNYKTFLGDRDGMEATLDFHTSLSNGGLATGLELASACRVCEYPSPYGADMVIGLHGADLGAAIPVMATSARGEALLGAMGLPAEEPGDRRDKALAALTEQRVQARDAMMADVAGRTSTLEDLAEYLSDCVNCYNCRVACPVCYCKECVFNTDVFEHKPWQYLGWAKRKGSLKLPTDTVFYHLTRMAHMSTACIGCGQCSNACPNGVEVMELFRTVAAKTQAGFDYMPGLSLDQAPPLTVFKEDEYQDTVSHLG